MNTVAVLYVHGINVDQADYADDLHANAVRAASRLVSGPFKVITKSVCWWEVFAPMAASLKEATHKSSFGWWHLRDLVLTTAAQAVGYEDGPGVGSYELVHRRIAAAIAELGQEAPGASLLVVAHSLGTVVTSNYIWDNREALPQLRGLVTLGSPLALYAGRYANFGQPLDMRGHPWMNVMYPSDVIGWPLQGLNADYHRQVTEDILLTPSWFNLTKTPASHTDYWGSDEVAAIVGDMVFKLWDDERSR